MHWNQVESDADSHFLRGKEQFMRAGGAVLLQTASLVSNDCHLVKIAGPMVPPLTRWDEKTLVQLRLSQSPLLQSFMYL